MDTSERLAAYAAGELGPDEAHALEAELAGDVSLRRRLAAIRRVDEALGSLPAVEPSPAFSASLREALRSELASGAGGATHADVVDLDQRRRRRQRWLAPAAGVAAAAAAVVGLVQIGQGGDQDRAETTALAPMADDGERVELQAAESGEPQPIYAEGGSYDRETLALLAQDESILAVRDVAGSDPSAVQFDFLDRLADAASGAEQRGSQPSMESAPGIAREEDAYGSAGGTQFSPVNPVAACVPVVLEEDRVPLFADLGTFEGAQALVVVLGAPAPDGSFSRLELWVLDPVSCDVLHFAQR